MRGRAEEERRQPTVIQAAGLLTAFLTLTHTGLGCSGPASNRPFVRSSDVQPKVVREPQRLTSFQKAIVQDLDRQVRSGIQYQDGYFTGGDPPPNLGVCTDVVIRAYRTAGVDLQRLLASDVRSRRRAYDIRKPDPDIDHRRCRNLVVFLEKHGSRVPPGVLPWEPGDLVFWDTSRDGVVDHVGVISGHADGRPTVVHHWPGAPVAEMVGVDAFPITHRFRWRN